MSLQVHVNSQPDRKSLRGVSPALRSKRSDREEVVAAVRQVYVCICITLAWLGKSKLIMVASCMIELAGRDGRKTHSPVVRGQRRIAVSETTQSSRRRLIYITQSIRTLNLNFYTMTNDNTVVDLSLTGLKA